MKAKRCIEEWLRWDCVSCSAILWYMKIMKKEEMKTQKITRVHGKVG
jgi:hypothetical protein